MSIVTKTGDNGTTALMYGRRVPKAHPRVEAYGCLDELTSAIGLARATTEAPFVRDHLLAMQKDLVIVMGEVATLTEDLPRFERDGFSRVVPAMTAKLDVLANNIETQKVHGKDWALPGGTPEAAALDLARAVCRRAERRVCALQEARELPNAEILVYLNRLSDVLWLLARWVEAQRGVPGSGPMLV